MTGQGSVPSISVMPGARARLWQPLIDLAAPVLITVATVHELSYNDAGVLTWILALLIVWPLAWRRHAPVIVFVACVTLGVAFWATDTSTFADLAPLVALYAVAAHRGLRLAIGAAIATEVGALLVAVRFAPTGSVNDAVILLSGLVAAALLLGTTVRAQRRYLASVEDRAARLEHDRAQQARLAAAQERARIAREMHDIVAHGLSVVITLAQGAAVIAEEDPQAASGAMDQAAAAGRQALDEMRGLLHVLRADVPDGSDPQPDLVALESLLEDVRATGLVVRTKINGDARTLAAGLQATLYRIVREALTNVLKHAGQATTVEVVLDATSRQVQFSIADDGLASGTDPAVGNGLIGMRERVAMFGGTLDAGPAATGWLVRGCLPLTQLSRT